MTEPLHEQALRALVGEQAANRIRESSDYILPPSPGLQEKLKRLRELSPPTLDEVKVQFAASAKIRAKNL